MKRLIAILFLLCLTFSVRAQIVTATVTVTNGTTSGSGQSITVNGATRVWTNVVTSASTQILTNSTISGATSNLYSSYVVTPPIGVQVINAATNQVQFKSFPGISLTVLVSNGWASVAYSTNTITNTTVVRVPLSAYGTAERADVENGLISLLNDNAGSSLVATNAPAFVNLVFTNKAQTNWNKTLISPVLITPLMSSPTLTNAVLLNPFLQVSTRTWAITNSLTFSDSSGNIYFTMLPSINAMAIDFPNNGNAAWAFDSNTASLYDRNENLLMLTGTNLLMLLAPETDISNAVINLAKVVTLRSGASVLNGTNILGGVVAFSRTNNSSLANGNNAGVLVGTNAVLSVSGPTGAFTINGIVPAAIDTQTIIVQNRTGQTMTIANDSGVDATAANRIYTGTASDFVITNNPGVVRLMYDTAVSRWVIVGSNK